MHVFMYAGIGRFFLVCMRLVFLSIGGSVCTCVCMFRILCLVYVAGVLEVGGVCVCVCVCGMHVVFECVCVSSIYLLVVPPMKYLGITFIKLTCPH